MHHNMWCIFFLACSGLKTRSSSQTCSKMVACKGVSHWERGSSDPLQASAAIIYCKFQCNNQKYLKKGCITISDATYLLLIQLIFLFQAFECPFKSLERTFQGLEPPFQSLERKNHLAPFRIYIQL